MLNINVRAAGKAVVLQLDGDLRTPDGDSAFVEAVARCVYEGYRSICADFATVRHADAAGLGALVRARNLLAGVGGELRLINPNEFVHTLLRLTRLHTILTIVPAAAPRRPAEWHEPRHVVSVRMEPTASHSPPVEAARCRT